MKKRANFILQHQQWPIFPLTSIIILPKNKKKKKEKGRALTLMPKCETKTDKFDKHQCSTLTKCIWGTPTEKGERNCADLCDDYYNAIFINTALPPLSW